jgi:DNA-binding transcriptional MerR regulator
MNDRPHRSADPHWTIAELSAKVGEALSVDYGGQPNGQISDVPNARTIRYYTTLGLIDRAAEMRGRTALYGVRHLRQLVAIKRLQLEGLSLTEIQARLTGATNETLARLARVPSTATPELEAPLAAHSPGAQAPEPEAHRLTRPARREAFWQAAAPEPSVEPPVPSPVLEPSLLTGVPLAPDVTLLLAASRSLDAADLAALETAVAPLLSILRARGILASRHRGDEP